MTIDTETVFVLFGLESVTTWFIFDMQYIQWCNYYYHTTLVIKHRWYATTDHLDCFIYATLLCKIKIYHILFWLNVTTKDQNDHQSAENSINSSYLKIISKLLVFLRHKNCLSNSNVRPCVKIGKGLKTTLLDAFSASKLYQKRNGYLTPNRKVSILVDTQKDFELQQIIN